MQTETARMTLRPFTPEDAHSFLILSSHPDIIRYTGRQAMTSTEEARQAMEKSVLRDYQQYGYGRLACICKATGNIIGFAGLKYVPQLRETDIGYRFLPEYWGQGLATEASHMLLRYGRETLGLSRIVGIVDPENKASVGVLLKLGMVYEKNIRLDFTETDLALYA